MSQTAAQGRRRCRSQGWRRQRLIMRGPGIRAAGSHFLNGGRVRFAPHHGSPKVIDPSRPGLARTVLRRARRTVGTAGDRSPAELRLGFRNDTPVSRMTSSGRLPIGSVRKRSLMRSDVCQIPPSAKDGCRGSNPKGFRQAGRLRTRPRSGAAPVLRGPTGPCLDAGDASPIGSRWPGTPGGRPDRDRRDADPGDAGPPILGRGGAFPMGSSPRSASRGTPRSRPRSSSPSS